MRLLRLAWHVLVGIKDGLVLLFMLIFFALLYALFTATPNPAVPGSGALHLDLDGVIVEQPAEVDPWALLSGSAADMTREHRLRDVIRALETAATDERVTAVALDLDGFVGGGASAIAETGDAIQAVRDAGKPVIAFATAYTDDSYALAAHASEIWMDPLGLTVIAGPGGSSLYFAELMDRLGVTANVFRVGAYKAAVEPFTRSDQSPESREAEQALVDTMFEIWRDDVSQARPRAELAAFVANPLPDTTAGERGLARRAQAAGMVDQLGDRAGWSARVAEVSGSDASASGPGFRSIRLANWIAANPAPSGGPRIGVLVVAGTIVDGEAGPGTAAGQTISDLMDQAIASGELRALVVRIDSPGGSVYASEQIRRAVLRARAQGIPVVISMGNLAASGGYWVATAGQHIFAEPSTITGSIGVFAIVPSFEGALDELGVGVDGVRTTPLSGQPDLLGGLSPEVGALFQTSVNDVYRQFIVMVAQSRDMDVRRVHQISQGRVWSGATARQLGLVDEFGSLDDAVAHAARLADLDPESARPWYIEQEPSAAAQFLATWFTEPEEQAPAANAWAAVLPDPRATLARVAEEARALLAGPAIQARCLECPSDRPARLGRGDAALLSRLFSGAGR